MDLLIKDLGLPSRAPPSGDSGGAAAAAELPFPWWRRRPAARAPNKVPRLSFLSSPTPKSCRPPPPQLRRQPRRRTPTLVGFGPLRAGSTIPFSYCGACSPPDLRVRPPRAGACLSPWRAAVRPMAGWARCLGGKARLGRGQPASVAILRGGRGGPVAAPLTMV